MPDIVIVSDRGPFSFVDRDGNLVPVPRHSSVTQLLDAAVRRIGEPVAWVSASPFPDDRIALRRGAFDRLSPRPGCRLRPRVFDRAEFARYYHQASARGLWTALLDLWEEMPEFGAVEAAAYDSYERVNRALGRAAVAESTPDALVLVHDYQLTSVAKYVRRRRPRQAVSFFLHTPFAVGSSLARLPEQVCLRLADGLLAADLLGFQRREWLDRFLDWCRGRGFAVDPVAGLVRHDRGRTWARCYPTPIEVERVTQYREDGAVAAHGARLRPDSVEQLVVRVDRVDPTKNVVRGFRAFERLLRRHPELHGRVRFVACLVPTRREVEEYRRYEDEIRDAVATTLTAFPDSVAVYWGEDRARAMAALGVYDVLLVSPLSDGMNLVAQEGPAVNRLDGAVVLSSTAGAADLLGEYVVPIGDPTDIEETANALLAALRMPAAERRRRAAAMRRLVTARDPAQWLGDQLSDLELVRKGNEPESGAYQQG